MRPAPNDMGDLAAAVRTSGNQELVGRADRLLMAESAETATVETDPNGTSLMPKTNATPCARPAVLQNLKHLIHDTVCAPFTDANSNNPVDPGIPGG